ncbi:MAG: RecB family exonuclease [Pirellulaceae bacterium]
MSGPPGGEPQQSPHRPYSSRPHWSYSQISQFLRCPLQYYFERILKLPRPAVPGGMALGSAIHSGLADFHRHLQRGEEFSKEQFQKSFLDAFSADDTRPLELKENETRQSLTDQGIALLEAYWKEPRPEKIIAVEEPLLVPLVTSSGEVLEKPLVTVVDLLSRSDEELLIDEFKTSSRKYSEAEAESALQASCYVHAVRERYDEPATVRYTVLVKTKTPAIQRLTTVRTQDDFHRIGDVVQTIQKAIDAQAFYPVESPMNCSGCSFRSQCREWHGSVAPPVPATSQEKEPVPC